MLIKFTSYEKLGQATHIIKGYTITQYAGQQYFSTVIDRSKEVEAYCKAINNIMKEQAVRNTQVDILTFDARIVALINQRRGLGTAFDKMFSNAYRNELTYKAHYYEAEKE